MRRPATSWLLALACLALPARLMAKPLKVIATVPDLADMAREIGGDNLQVSSLATGKEDLHSVPARPSFLPKLNRADLLLTLGLGAEHAWLDGLVEESRNPRIAEGGTGRVDASRGLAVLGIPARFDRGEGEQHPRGNPHYNIDPSSGPVMARNLAQAFILADPDRAAAYRKGLETYLAKLEALEKELQAKGKALQGVKVVDYHPDIPYLARFYGLVIAGSIEPKPGVPPPTSHLAQLTRDAKQAGVRLIIHNQSQDRRLPEKLAGPIGAARVEIANAVGAKEGIATWIDLQRYNLEVLLKPLSAQAVK